MPLRFRVIQCDHGDTILVTDAHSVLMAVDFNLIARVKAAVSEVLFEGSAPAVRFLCITHPHQDHFNGVNDIYSLLKSKKLSVERYCDSFFNPYEIQEALESSERSQTDLDFSASVNEYIRFLDEVYDDIDKGKVEFVMGAKTAAGPVRFVGAEDLKIAIYPLSPNPGLVKRVCQRVIKFGNEYKAMNEVSCSFVAEFESGEGRLAAYFAGDCSGSVQREALEEWCNRSSWEHPEDHLGFIKVGHHGSAISALANSSEFGSAIVNRTAVISVGTRFPALPSRVNIQSAIDGGWGVYATTCRVGSTMLPDVKSAGEAILAHASTSPRFQYLRHDVNATWDGKNRLTVEPVASLIKKEHLPFYK